LLCQVSSDMVALEQYASPVKYREEKMPKIASAKKNLRKNQRRAKSNLAVKEKLKQELQKSDTLTLPELYKIIDKAAKKRVISKGRANRLKSKVQKNVGKKVVKTQKTKAKKTTKRTKKIAKTKSKKQKKQP